MRSEAANVLKRFRDLRVVVVGEAMLDVYTRGYGDRLCREAPVPIIDIEREDLMPGGAANTAANLAALGARVSLLSAVGDDREGQSLISVLQAQGVDVAHTVVEPGRSTLSKQRVLAGSQLLLRLDRGSKGPIAPPTEARLIAGLEALYADADTVVISDYAYGIVTSGLIEMLERLQARSPRPVFCDAKDLRRYARLRPAAVKPNYVEALGLLDQHSPARGSGRAQAIEGSSARLLELTGAALVAVTVDVDGVLLLQSDGRFHSVTATGRTAARAAGAGDAFLAGLALALTAGCDSVTAAQIATTAASIAVRRDGTAVCTVDELCRELTRDTAPSLTDRQEIVCVVDEARAAGKRIVFTNGCFDIVHSGHTRFLRDARAEGDLLIVGLNSDDSVRRLKGADRPVNGLADRAQVLQALSCVDHVVAFDEDTPDALLRLIRPHVFAKGGDYTYERLPEAELVTSLGGIVRILDYVEDHSTTALIHRIRARDLRPSPAARTEVAQA